MTTKLGALSRVVALAGALGGSIVARPAPAWAEPRHIRVQLRAAPGYDELLRRLVAELESDGFETEPLAPEAPWPCAATLPPATASEPGEPQTRIAGIELRSEADGQLSVEVCYLPPPTAAEHAQLRGSPNDPARLALATVEALNGLTAPIRANAAPEAPASAPTLPAALPNALPDASRTPPATHPPDASRAAVHASTALVLQPSLQPLVGAGLGIDVSIHRHVALELEIIAPLRAIHAAGDDRELSIAAAWARAGVRPSWSWFGSSLGLSLHAGLALVWASATTRDPSLVGTTELAHAVIVSGGAWFESPREGRLYFRAASHVSRLLPSADIALGGGATRAFGELALELGLGVGVRWSSE